MKPTATASSTRFAALLASLALAASSAVACDCCDKEKPAATTAKPAACCAPAEPAAAPLSGLSVYQLDARWTDDTGATRTLTEFRGRPVVVAMFFASCEFVCPATVADMLKIQAALPADQRERAAFVLVTFDLARDSQAALAAYRGRMNLGPQWTLLRGTPAGVQDLAAVLGVKFKQDARGQFAHSNLITVLNTEGEVALQRAGFRADLTDAVRTVLVSATR